MGWRADKAREEDERRAWRAWLAALPFGRRVLAQVVALIPAAATIAALGTVLYLTLRY